MKIDFQVQDKRFRMEGDKYQVQLSRIYTVENGDNKGKEATQLVGYYKDEFQALERLTDIMPRESECTTFDELAAYRKQVLDEIREIAAAYKANLKVEVKQ